MIERYRLVRELGRSPHAVTTLRTDTESGTRCVVKSLDLGDVDDLKIIEMFRREAKVLRGLDHPGIPKLLDAFDERGESRLVLHLVQEYVEGDNLAVAREKRGSFSEDEVVTIARDLLEVLRYLHSFSPPIIHRDIKPANVILGRDGAVRLIDFSGVRDTMKQDRNPEGGFTVVGSFGYMPFEQYEGRAFPASDIYALGMTLIFLLTGLEPADLERSGMRSLVPADAAISPGLRRVLERMIEPDVEKRYASAGEVERDLPAPAMAERPKVKQHGALIALLLVGAIGIFFAMQSAQRATAPDTIPAPPAAPRPAPTAPVVAPSPAPEPFELRSPDPDTSRLSAQGLLTFAGQPLESTFRETPVIRIYREGAQDLVDVPMRYANSTLEIFDLKPGTYSVWARHAAGEHWYHGGHEIVVDATRVVQFEFHLSRQISLEPLKGARRVEGRCEVVTVSPVVITWRPFENDTFYDYDVYENRCDNKGRGRPLLSGTTNETSLTLELPESGPGMRYQVNLGARRSGAWVGNGGTMFVVEKGERR